MGVHIYADSLYAWSKAQCHRCDDADEHIEAETKWPQIRRRHFRMHFHESKLLSFE